MPYGGAPTAGSTDELRLLVGDTDTTDEQLSDAEYSYILTNFGSGQLGAAQAARMLAAKYARLRDVSVGDVSESASQMFEHYRALADQLDTKTASLALPTFGGVDVAAVEQANADASQVQPAFKRDQFNNPRANNKNDPFDSGGGL